MILYNVTIKIDWPIHEEWLQWMKEVYIPGMLSTGFFIDYRTLRLLLVDDSDGPTYAIQYYASSLDDYKQFAECHSNIQSRKEFDKWGDKMVTFGTIMEVVQ